MYLDSKSLRHDIGAACSVSPTHSVSHTFTRVAATNICSAHSCSALLGTGATGTKHVSNYIFLRGLCAAVTVGSSSQAC